MTDDKYRTEAPSQPWIPRWGFRYHAKAGNGSWLNGTSTWPAATDFQVHVSVTLINLRSVEADLDRRYPAAGKWAISHFSLVWCDVNPDENSS